MAIKRYFYSACQKCRERYLRSKSSKSKVLTFHQVNDNTSLWFDKTCSMTKKSFAALLSNLMVRGYRFGALSDLENKQQDGKRLFLTFDDAYVDVYTNCYPLLKKYNIPFYDIIYVIKLLINARI
jgi:peptidoglycan/xylan/chitin deacetylase (PgdA/CDA1 family)